MGRRIVAVVDPVKDRRAAARALETLMERYDPARFRASLHVADMVDILAGFARDLTLDPEFRRDCAKDVMIWSGGVPSARVEIGALDPAGPASPGDGPEDATVGDVMEATRATAKAFLLMEQWAAVPPDQWPVDVREALGAAAYAPA